MGRSYCIILLVVSFYFIGCAPEERPAFYEKVEASLADHSPIKNPRECTFEEEVYALLYNKPEYSELRDEELCMVDYRVEAIHERSDTAAIVEYTVLQKANVPVLEDFLKAWSEMEERLLALMPMAIPHPDEGMVVVYSDPYDGHYFLQKPEEDRDIRNTAQWEGLKTIKESVEQMLEKGSLEVETVTENLKKINGDWIIKDTEES